MRKRNPHTRSMLRLECLERRDAPATLVSPMKVTYQDADGDNVAVIFSKPILTPVNADTIFGVGFVTGDNNTPQQLETIDLTGVGAAATGMNITTLATRSPVNGSDGFAAVGHINATGIDLGRVSIDGDLGRVRSGDAVTATPGLKGLTVHSMGRYALSTGAPDLVTIIQGRLDFMKVKSDMKEAQMDVQGSVDGKIGEITIGGSVLGGTSAFSGRIRSAGDKGMVAIGGNLTGAGGDNSGQVSSLGKLAGV